jgi:hypothetical protein
MFDSDHADLVGKNHPQVLNCFKSYKLLTSIFSPESFLHFPIQQPVIRNENNYLNISKFLYFAAIWQSKLQSILKFSSSFEH